VFVAAKKDSRKKKTEDEKLPKKFSILIAERQREESNDSPKQNALILCVLTCVCWHVCADVCADMCAGMCVLTCVLTCVC
jgi:hypothetical protein